MFTSLPDRLRQTIPILLDALWNHSFDKKVVTQEKAVITSEIETAHLNQQLSYHYQLISMLSPASPAAVFPAGRKKILRRSPFKPCRKPTSLPISLSG